MFIRKKQNNLHLKKYYVNLLCKTSRKILWIQTKEKIQSDPTPDEIKKSAGTIHQHTFAKTTPSSGSVRIIFRKTANLKHSARAANPINLST